MKERLRALALSPGRGRVRVCAGGGFYRRAGGFRPTDIWESCASVMAVGLALPRGHTSPGRGSCTRATAIC